MFYVMSTSCLYVGTLVSSFDIIRIYVDKCTRNTCSGIKELSPLCWLPYFCLVWDIMPDMMHIITGIWSRHFLHMLTGERYPSEVKSRKKNTVAENKALARDAKACVESLDSWALDKVCLAFL